MVVQGLGKPDSCLVKLTGVYNSLKPAERAAAEYILQNKEEVIHLSITDLAERSGTSDATIMRLCRRLECRGFQEFKIKLAQEIVPPLNSIHEDLEDGDDLWTMVGKVFQANVAAIQDTFRNLDKESFVRAINALASARRILFYGVASSGAVARDAEHKFIKTGIPCAAYSDVFLQATIASLLGPGDVVVGISHSGATKAVCNSVEIARNAGATTIAITQASKSPITRIADIVLYTYAKESAYRDEAVSSRIAQLCIIDSLCLAISAQRQDLMIENLKRTRAAAATMRY